MHVKRTENRMSNRYEYDLGQCSLSQGFAQIDTPQDASYFGCWTNPFTLVTLCYLEGDVITNYCATVAEYCADLRETQRFNKKNGELFAIDGMLNRRMIERFKKIGLADLLH